MYIFEIQKDELLYAKALELRYIMFFKEHNLSKDILRDEWEEKSTHIVISQNDELIAYGRLSVLNFDEAQISQMVVSPNHQRKGFGVKLLLELMLTAKNNGAKSIKLNARSSAVDFYRKYGFQRVGHIYYSRSTGVPHVKMVHLADT